MNKLFKITIGLFAIFFLSLYYSGYASDYYEKKTNLTEQAIEQYEKDLREGKEINIEDYQIKEKNYNNKSSTYGRKISNWIEKLFNKVLKYLIKFLDDMQ